MQDAGEILVRTFTDVMRQYAFMFVDPPEADGIELPDGSFLRARLDFGGALVGSLLLTVPRSLTPQLAANVLGAEEDDPQVRSLAEDALVELLNITCGHLVTALAGRDVVVDLTTPHVEEVSQDVARQETETSGSRVCEVESLPVVLRLTLGS